MKMLTVSALCLFPLGVLQSQVPESQVTPPGAAHLGGIETGTLVWNPASSPAANVRSSQFSFRPVVYGALIGGALGAFVGHEVGAPQECPASPSYSCGKPAFGTAGGAALGMILGGAVGAVIGMRQHNELHADRAPVVHVTGGDVGLGYSRRF